MAKAPGSKIDIEEAYQMWKSGKSVQSICDHFDCTRATFYKYKGRSITGANGVKYTDWSERLAADEKEERETFEVEINNLMANGHKLIEVARDKYLMKLIKYIDEPNFKPNVADGVKIVEAAEKMLARLAEAESADGGEDKPQTTVIINNKFRSDTCE